jgi:hypothetical protein
LPAVTKPCLAACDIRLAIEARVETTVNTTMYVVNGFHQGRRLLPQYFSCEVQAQACAASMCSVFDGVALATTTRRSLAQRGDATARRGTRATPLIHPGTSA